MAITTSYSWVHGTGLLLNNVFTNSDQLTPNVAGNSAGDRYFAAWSDPDNGWQAQGRIVEADQTPLANEFTVNATANLGTWQYDPGVANLTGGDFVVTYTDFSADPGGDIRARLYSPGGAARGLDFAIDTHAAFDDSGSRVAALSGGGFVVTYMRDQGIGDYDIRARVFDQNGGVVSGQIFVDSSAGSQSAPSVAGLSSGGFVAAWQDDDSSEVYFRRYQADGAALDADRVLIDTNGSINRDIDVAALADGGFAVAYVDNGWSIDGTEITFRIFNADGTTRTSFIRANNEAFGGFTAGSQLLPTITTMGDLIVVGWKDMDSQTSHAQVFDAQGNAVGGNSTLSTDVVEHEIAGLSGGRLANVWRSHVPEGLGLGESMRSNVEQFMRTLLGDDGGNDVIIGVDDALKERLVGLAGDDTLIGGAGGDELLGGSGSDTVSYETAPAGVRAGLSSPS